MEQLTKLKINIGPQHPSTHGVLRLILELEGEIIKSIEPKIGYLHRGMEKMAENRSYLQYLPIVDRIDYLSSFFCAEAYCLAVEELLGLQVPKTAQYLRVLMMELNRISSHLLWLGTFMLDLGASSPFFYTFRERESVLALFEVLTGSRMMYNYHTFGGVKKTISAEFTRKLNKLLKDFPQKIDEYEAIITQNPIFTKRVKNAGILSSKMASEYSITGANLRATGVELDFRKIAKYEIYEDLEFNVPTTQCGDSYSRYLVRIKEMRESLKIAKQCLDWLSANANEYKSSVKSALVKPKEGLAIGQVESPRGLLACMVYSDGTSKPTRVKWRTPSFYAAQLLPQIAQGNYYADLMAIFGSLDVILPEVDR